jgi:hypothetical protein
MDERAGDWRLFERDGRLAARYEAPDRVFEVGFDAVRVTDVTLQFIRDGTKVGSVYNDYGTERTMAHLDAPGEGDFVGVEVPKAFVAALLEAAERTDRVDESGGSLGAYRTRVLDDRSRLVEPVDRAEKGANAGADADG